MKLRQPSLSTALLFTALVASCTPALVGQKPDTTLTEGSNALNEQRWNDALKFFDKVVQADGSRTDEALYWKAYTLTKLNRGDDAAATCNLLRARFVDSSWNKDCVSLLINTKVNVQTNAAVARSVARSMSMQASQADMQFNFNNLQFDFAPGGLDPESDIKILALNSLMKQNPAQATPMIRGILTGNNSIQMKNHALFILARDKSPESKALLEDVAKGKMGPELQREGVRYVAVSQGTKDNDMLVDLYKSSTDVKLKESVISAIATTKDAPRLVDMARNEKDLKLKRDIVAYLAPMHDKIAQDYMLELLK